MLSYIKVITCIHCDSKKATILQKTSAATVAACMNARQAETAMSILNACIASQAASIPRNAKTLTDTVLQIVDDRTASQEANAANKRSRSPKSNRPTAKGTAGRPPAEQTPNARSSQSHGRNNATTQGSAQRQNNAPRRNNAPRQGRPSTSGSSKKQVKFIRKPRGGS